MTTFRLPTLAMLAAAAALVAGCASDVKLDEPKAAAPVESRTVGEAVAPVQRPAAGTAATPQSQVATVDLTKQAQPAAPGPELARTIYFDFDSFMIRDEFKPVVESHAKRLTANAQRRLVVEGHTDDRGSREYNLALGQKRAEAVARSLALLGAGAQQVEAVSFGEERPAVQGENEDAWAKNRRAELKDR